MDPATFAQFAEVLAEATLLVDGRGIVLTANMAAATLLGCRRTELIGRPLASLAVGGEAAVAELIRLGSRSSQRLLGALDLRVGEGQLMQTRVEFAAIRGRVGDQPALVSLRLFERHEAIGRFVLLTQRIDALSREVALRREAEAKLESYSAQLVEAGRRKDEFLAMLAHELRNPLAPMALSVDLLDSVRSVDPRVERVAGVMRRQLDHLKRLVDDLLDVARLTHGKIELHRQPVRLDQVLERAVEMFQAIAAEKGLQVQVDHPSLHVTVEVDAVRMVQAFGNLLSNAIKFSSTGSRIAVGAKRADGGIVTWIRDEGAGIGAELLPHVFDLFVQADRSLDRLHGGLGVGLAVVRSVVELHGGRVSASSAGLGHGTEIQVWLPLLETGPAAARSALRPAPVIANGADQTAAPRLRVMVVEDNADAAEAMRDILVEWGHEAVCVGDGSSALELWQHWQPDVGLFDIGLPGMSGLELARACRQLAAARPMLMLALSGYGSAADLQASRDAGFDAHLVKPVDLDRLEAMLARQRALCATARPDVASR